MTQSHLGLPDLNADFPVTSFPSHLMNQSAAGEELLQASQSNPLCLGPPGTAGLSSAWLESPHGRLQRPQSDSSQNQEPKEIQGESCNTFN